MTGGRRKDLLQGIAVAGALVAAPLAGAGASFREAPPTIGVYRATAYTLRGGEWQIGAWMGFQLVPLAYSTATVSVANGITSWFQAGIAVAHGVQAGPLPSYMTYGLSAKLRLPLGSTLDLGVPLATGFLDRGMGTEFNYLQSGAVASIRMGAGLTLHGGVGLGFSRGGSYFYPYVIVDFDLLPNLKLMAEVGMIPFSAAVGAWARFLDFLDVRVAAAVVPFSFTAGIHLRL